MGLVHEVVAETWSEEGRWYGNPNGLSCTKSNAGQIWHRDWGSSNPELDQCLAWARREQNAAAKSVRIRRSCTQMYTFSGLFPSFAYRAAIVAPRAWSTVRRWPRLNCCASDRIGGRQCFPYFANLHTVRWEHGVLETIHL